MTISNTTEIEKCLWEAADELRANSKLKASKCSVPELILLRYVGGGYIFVHRLLMEHFAALYSNGQ
jgi:hypothetical protein